LDQQNRVCPGCPHHRPEDDRCALISEGRFAALVEGQPCRAEEWIHQRARGYLLRRFPDKLDLAEDIAQDVLSKLCDPQATLPVGRLHTLAAFTAYVDDWIGHHVTNVLLHQRELVRIRCGNCGHFQAGRGQTPSECRLEYWTDPQGTPTSNPHFGPGNVYAHSDPRRLEPPCQQFVNRRERFVSLEAAAGKPDPTTWPSPQERLHREIEAALEGLMRESPRCAKAVVMYFLRGQDQSVIASILKVNRRTVQRDLKRACERLQQLLNPLT